MVLRSAGLTLFCLLACVTAHAAGVSAHVTTPAGTALEDAAVVLEPLAATPPSLPRRNAVIAQQDREFVPYATIVQTGTHIEFPNRDPMKHHVYSFSSAKNFEIKLYVGLPAQPVLFDKAGEVAIGCNVHDWMEAYVLVVDTPYFAKTGTNGHASINNVPPGRYRLRLWHPRQKIAVVPREVEVKGNVFNVDLTLDAPPRVIKPKPPADDAHY
jgi:plastocyanin